MLELSTAPLHHGLEFKSERIKNLLHLGMLLLRLELVLLERRFKFFDGFLEVKLSDTGLMLCGHLIIKRGLLSEFALGRLWRFLVRRRGVIIQEVVIKVLNLTLQVVLLLLLRIKESVILIINGVQHNAQFFREELIDVIHKELLGEGEILRNSLEVIFIIVLMSSLDTFSDKISITSLFNQFVLDVVMEELKCLGVVLSEDFPA